MGVQTIRQLLDCLGDADPHEFATAYVNHVEAARTAGVEQTPVTLAVQRWMSRGSI